MNLTSFFCNLMQIPFFSYSKFQISGKVTEANGQELEFANVLLKDSTDNIMTDVFTNKDGVYTIVNVSKGKYTVIVSFIGYKNQIKEILVDKDIELGPVALEERGIGILSKRI
ncbi:carboxypeptidase-like regulatory domain-containing protein [Sinomicrobium sp. M5D2P9]